MAWIPIAIIVGAVVMSLWSLINFVVCVIVWATGQLISADKKIVAYMAVVSLFSFAAFTGAGVGMFLLLDKLTNLT